MKFGCTLIAVTDMDRAKAFYHDVLGLNVVDDFGANVTLTGGIALQTLDTWVGFIRKDKGDVTMPSNAGELYFEAEDIDGFMKKLDARPDIRLLHPLVEHAWGQRAVRFYDPDGHIIEVGEDLREVVGRFLKGGLTVEETAKRMDVPVEYVLNLEK